MVDYGCPSSFTTLVINPEVVEMGVENHGSTLEKAKNLEAIHELVPPDKCITEHSYHE